MKQTVRWLANLLPPAAGLVALVLVLMAMAGKFHEKVHPGLVPYQRAKAPTEAVADVLEQVVVETVPAVATVQPRQRVDVASRILATITAVHVDAADRVKKGQLLVELDDREVQAQLREAEAGLAAAQADYDVRFRDFQRAEQLLKEKAITKEEFDRVRGAFEIAKAQLERARQQLERVQVVASYTQIRAPADGIVSDRYADPGDLAVPGKPLLSLYDPRQLELHASVREGLANLLEVGQKLQVRIDAAKLETTGTVREIVPEADIVSRAVTVKVQLPTDSATRLYLGMFGRIFIPVGERKVAVVPAAAIRYVGQLELVDVVLADGSTERRFVRVGRRLNGTVEILAGLRPGERVLLHRSVDGSRDEQATAGQSD